MASYQKINNTLDFAVAFNPTTAFPLDARTMFGSYAAAVAAAATAENAGSANTVYYFGQTLTVFENDVAKQYIIQGDKSLREVGSGAAGNLLLGESATTAYRGDRGKIAYDHSQVTHAPTNAERNTIVGVQKNGADLTVNSSTRKVNITVPTKTSEITNDSGYLTVTDIPEGSAGTTTTPKMDGVAEVGIELAFARGDHRHPSDISKVDKEDGKGLSSNDFTTEEKNKLNGIALNANNYTLPSAGVSLGGVKTGGDVTINAGVITVNDNSHNHTAYVNQNAFSNVKVGTTTIGAETTTDTVEFAAGTNVTLTPDSTNDKVTINATDTTYNDATTTASGLMSASDKTKLNNIANYANNYSLPTASATQLGGVKVGSGLAINSGVLSVTGGGTADSVDWSNVQNKPSFHAVATSGSYNDLTNRPNIPVAYTLPVASASVLGGIKSGGDITVNANGVVSVNDNSHNHTAYVNQNAFSNIKVGTTTVAADTTTDTLELVAGTNITLTPDVTNDKVTISAAKSGVTSAEITTALGYTPADYANTGKSLGTSISTDSFFLNLYNGGNVPLSQATIPAVSDTKAGLMTPTYKSKLDGIANSANNYTHPESHPSSMITGLGNAATKNVGTTAGTVSEGNHTHADKANLSGGKVAVDEASASIVDASVSRNLASTDSGKLVRCTNSSAITLTIPSGGFSVGCEIEFCRYGSGTVTFAASAGVTLVSADSARSIETQYGSASLKQITSNVWWLVGGIA